MKASAGDERIQSLRDFYRAHKRLPTYCEALGMWHVASKNAVHKIMHRLISQGLLTKDSLGKMMPCDCFFETALLGQVPAGFPVPDPSDLSDTLSIDQYLIEKPGSSFLLKVSGDSLKDAGILIGDLAIIERTTHVRENDIVLARVDGEWTLKRYSKKGNVVMLMPANDAYKPIIPKEELSIYGVIKGVVRKYK